MRWILAVVLFAITVSLTAALDRKLGPLPPLGRLLDPFNGFWANAESARPFGDVAGEGLGLDLPGLRGKVTVQFDDRLVPHIYAENAHDLYYTQGYLHARMRLFQMDLLTRYAAGTLSEIIGSATINQDRLIRQHALPWAAERALAFIEKDSVTHEMIHAYTEGANSWISSLSYRDYPIEYKLLDAQPSLWSPLRMSLLARYMAWDLTSGSTDEELSNVLSQLGPEATADLYPDYPAKMDPIIPPGTKWDFKPVPIPKAPEANGVPIAAGKGAGLKPREKGKGSNNWALGPGRTASGNPILANDPHLKLTLPSIWFEQQLTAPGINVYGVVVPGSPGIGIGFNDDIAWGFTNVGADFVDQYQLEFKDSTQREYRYGEEWKPVTELVTAIKVKGEADRLDTTYFTHVGPIPFYKRGQKAPALAWRWLAYEPSNELKIFHTLMTAKNYADYERAMEMPFSFPQNMAFISREKDIAMWISGQHILRWREQGKFLSPMADTRYAWQGWLPSSHNPHVKNPPRGFVSSANQQSADPTYPYYLDWDQETYERGWRINRRIEQMKAATADTLRLLQADNYDLHAESILPTLLAQLDEKSLSSTQTGPYADLKRWDFFATAESKQKTVFRLWWGLLNRSIWRDDLNPDSLSVTWPDRDRTVQLITQTPTARWIDNRNTPEVETLQQLTRASFTKAVDSLTKLHGSYGESWAWASTKNQKLYHLMQLPGFSIPVRVGGGSGIVNAASNPEGPSWRMVVEMTPTGPKGHGIYPGGQSGNPGSAYYDNQVQTWVNYELKDLNWWPRPVELNKATTTLKLSPGKK
jgi:penicillin amidase